MNPNFNAMLRSASRCIFSVAAIFATSNPCLAGADKVLYDVTFNDPPNAVGFSPAFGAGPFTRHTPTSGGQIFAPSGFATVIDTFSLLTDQPVRLAAVDGDLGDGILGGVNLQFDLTDFSLQSLDRFHASVQVLFGEISTSTGFGVFWDAPAIHKVEFSNDGNIRVLDATGLDMLIGPYVSNTIYNVGMTFDKAAGTWSAAINGNPIYSGPADDIDLETFRIAMTTGAAAATSVAFVDNIKITADVPEPATFALAGLAIVSIATIASRRR